MRPNAFAGDIGERLNSLAPPEADPDQIGDADDADQRLDSLRGGVLLEVPIDFAVQRDPSLSTRISMASGGTDESQARRSMAAPAMFSPAFDVIGKLHLDFLGHGLHALHPSRRPLRRDLLCEASDVPG